MACLELFYADWLENWCSLYVHIYIFVLFLKIFFLYDIKYC